jgi:hypothetical protein
MTLSSRITEKGINAVIITLVLLAAGIYSCVAQAQSVLNVNYTEHPIAAVKNAGNAIHLDPNAILDANAVALNRAINSPYAELKPALTPDGNRLYFSRVFHPDNTLGQNDNEDIWYAERDKVSNVWSEPVRMSGVLNNEGPNFINNVSMTGDTIILGNQYLKKGKMRAGLSYSVNMNGQWTAPTPIHIQDDYNMSAHANSFVSLKSGVIISAIERAETYGKRDLYVSFWNGTLATEPINMGSVINTDLEESSPYLSSDNKTLYFASKGHAGYGGYDIYVSTRLDESWTNWSEPRNLGPAVNGALNDEFFSISHCGQYAVFSKQVSVHNTDLFKISTEELFLNAGNKKDKQSQKDASLLAAL